MRASEENLRSPRYSEPEGDYAPVSTERWIIRDSQGNKSIDVYVTALTLSSYCRGAGAPATTETQGAQQRQASLSRSWRPRPLRAPRVARPP